MTKPIIYSATELSELAALLKSTPENAVKRAGFMKLTPVCSRCLGSGQYSFNQVDGTRCYGCGGAGARAPKAKELSGVIEAARKAVAAGELDKYLDQLEAAAAAKKGRARVLGAYGRTSAVSCLEGFPSHSYRTEDLPSNGPVVRAAISALYAVSNEALAAISAWEFPKRGTSLEERRELAVKARAAIEEALSSFTALDVAPDADFVRWINERRRESYAAKLRGPWADMATLELLPEEAEA